MVANALGRQVVGLSAAVAVAAGCGRPAMPSREPSAIRAPAEGSAESQPTQGTAPSPSGSSTDATDGSDSGRDPHRMRRMIGWISLAIGAEAATIAVATSLLIEHQKSIRDEGCNAQKVCSSEAFGAVGTIDTITPWNTGSWFVAAAGLGAGIVLLLASPPQHERQTTVSLSPVSSGVDLSVRSTF
jgi:hypothetical protein